MTPSDKYCTYLLRLWCTADGRWLASLVDPQTIRFHQRVKAGQAEINGVKFESLEWLQGIGRKVADLRVKVTVDAINAYRATLPKP